jgi:ABC-type antimicrobial peptide transport system permease subunit
MKQPMSESDMNSLLEEMGGRLTANNLYIYGVRPVSENRNNQLKNYSDNANKQISLMAFLLVNVFFGIIGTFWLRTQHRRGETGIRMALGANRFTLKLYQYSEGLCILALTVPFILFFIANMYFADMLDTYRQAYTVLRFVITFGGAYLLLGAMICIGIRFPVQKTIRIATAEALHYE